MTWCTYKTTHPSGFVYFGKSSVERIQRGYTGSGRRLNCAYLQPGFEKSTWTTEILSYHETEEAAFAQEAKLVPLMRLCDPFCLNDTPGGRTGMRGSPYAIILKKNRAQKVKKTPRLVTIADVCVPKKHTSGGKKK